MNFEENPQERLIGDLRGIEVELYDLGMAGAIGAHVFVSGIGKRAAHVTDRRVRHTLYLTEGALHSPKTSRSECGFGHSPLLLAAIHVATGGRTPQHGAGDYEMCADLWQSRAIPRRLRQRCDGGPLS